VQQRAEARWTALMNKDYAAAYEFFSPAYRSVVSLQQFERTRGSEVQWIAARVNDVRYDSPTVAVVSVAVTYKYAMPRSGGSEIESIRELREQWLYKDGGWWYTSLQSG
jgi:uncharacterized protein YchJ